MFPMVRIRITHHLTVTNPIYISSTILRTQFYSKNKIVNLRYLKKITKMWHTKLDLTHRTKRDRKNATETLWL